MVLPLVAVAATLVLWSGAAAMALLDTQQSAAVLARAAAVTDDDGVHEVLAPGSGPVDTTIEITPPTGVRRPGDVVTVRIRRRLPIAWLPGADLPLTGVASALVEDVP